MYICKALLSRRPFGWNLYGVVIITAFQTQGLYLGQVSPLSLHYRLYTERAGHLAAVFFTVLLPKKHYSWWMTCNKILMPVVLHTVNPDAGDWSVYAGVLFPSLNTPLRSSKAAALHFHIWSPCQLSCFKHYTTKCLCWPFHHLSLIPNQLEFTNHSQSQAIGIMQTA